MLRLVDCAVVALLCVLASDLPPLGPLCCDAPRVGRRCRPRVVYFVCVVVRSASAPTRQGPVAPLVVLSCAVCACVSHRGQRRLV